MGSSPAAHSIPRRVMTKLLIFICPGKFGGSGGRVGTQGKPTQTSADKETWQSYEKSFETRWRDLLQHTQKGDKSNWTLLENDLRTNARKYNQRLEEEASKPMTGTTAFVNSTFTVPCLSQCDCPSYRCFIFPKRKGDCRYVCAPIQVKRGSGTSESQGWTQPNGALQRLKNSGPLAT